MKSLITVFLFLSVSASAVAQSELDSVLLVSRGELRKDLNTSRHQAGTEDWRNTSAMMRLRKSDVIYVQSATVLDEIGSAFSGIYNLQTNVLGLHIRDGQKRGLNFTSKVGLKGVEAQAIGAFSRKKRSTFGFNYSYSIEDLMIKGESHNFKLFKKF